jgi:hypothetical protein
MPHFFFDVALEKNSIKEMQAESKKIVKKMSYPNAMRFEFEKFFFLHHLFDSHIIINCTSFTDEVHWPVILQNQWLNSFDKKYILISHRNEKIEKSLKPFRVFEVNNVSS